MKIMFLCGALEPGRDGVGDYTRSLSAELGRQGHIVTAVALQDPFVAKTVNEVQTVDGIQLKILRIPSRSTKESRFEQANKWVNHFNPDFISLQFVPFSFNQKGLPFYLPRFLKQLGNRRVWHIMFHELWVGMDDKASVKNRLWGAVQKYLLINLVKQLAPFSVHTQSRFYLLQLKRAKIPAQLLPLFGNITVNGQKKLSKTEDSGVKKKKMRLIHFGNIHKGAPITDFALEAARYAKAMDIEIVLTLVGRYGKQGDEWSSIWKAKGMTVEALGEQNAEKVSELFLDASFGLSTTPFILIEKSGAVAAMLEHGLPIICVSREWVPRSFSDTTHLTSVAEFRKGNIEKCFELKSRVKSNTTVQSIAEQFLESIT